MALIIGWQLITIPIKGIEHSVIKSLTSLHGFGRLLTQNLQRPNLVIVTQVWMGFPAPFPRFIFLHLFVPLRQADTSFACLVGLFECFFRDLGLVHCVMLDFFSSLFVWFCDLLMFGVWRFYLSFLFLSISLSFALPFLLSLYISMCLSLCLSVCLPPCASLFYPFLPFHPFFRLIN